jgi:hypothetical protein
MALVYSGRASEVEGADAFLEAARATADDSTVATALTVVAVWWYVLGHAERCLAFAEEATLLARRIGNPSLMAAAGTYVGGALETTDPPRAQAILQTALEHANSVDYTQFGGTCVAWLGRMGTAAANPQWVTKYRSGLEFSYESGDATFVLASLDLYAQALANADRVEAAAELSASVAELAPHMSNPISIAHRRITNQRLLAKLGEERLAELSARGASLAYDEVVALAFAEIDRVIAKDDEG